MGWDRGGWYSWDRPDNAGGGLVALLAWPAGRLGLYALFLCRARLTGSAVAGMAVTGLGSSGPAIR